MDRIAIVSDLHGNMPALDAVFHDIRQRSISRVFCLGDLVGKGPDSAATVDRCREVCDVIIRGNWDDAILRTTEDPTIRWHQKNLGATRLAYLATLPPVFEFIISGHHVRLLHASPQGIYHRVMMNDTLERHLAMFDNTPLTGDAIVPDIVGYADIHVSFLKTFHQGILFNVGSVGNPLDLTQASYAILEGAFESLKLHPCSLQLIRVPYDIERSIRDAEEVYMPELEAYSRELRTARYRGLG